MSGRIRGLWTGLLVFAAVVGVSGAQAVPALDTTVDQHDVVVVGDGGAASNDAVVIRASTSETVRIRMIGGRDKPEVKTAADPKAIAWAASMSAKNGLEGSGVRPWHAVIQFEQFDEDGDKINGGTFEEWWTAPTRYKRVYASDKLSQTEYATDQGLYRVGDQRWPTRAELQVRSEVLTPFDRMVGIPGLRFTEASRNEGPMAMRCVLPDAAPTISDVPHEFCVAGDSDVLRFRRGWGWNQTTYNGIVAFEGRHVATRVTVTDGGKAYLKMQVLTLQELTKADEASLAVPEDAKRVGEDIVTGVQMRTLHTEMPDWQGEANGQHFSLMLQLLVGKDGHVESAKAISGPERYYKAAEKAASRWTFEPYLVLGQPVRVQTKIGMNQN
jgi:hypothetical protein